MWLPSSLIKITNISEETSDSSFKEDNVEGGCSFKTLVSIYKKTWRRITSDHNLYLNLNPHLQRTNTEDRSSKLFRKFVPTRLRSVTSQKTMISIFRIVTWGWRQQVPQTSYLSTRLDTVTSQNKWKRYWYMNWRRKPLSLRQCNASRETEKKGGKPINIFMCRERYAAVVK
jgi:hypothetical protein